MLTHNLWSTTCDAQIKQSRQRSSMCRGVTRGQGNLREGIERICQREVATDDNKGGIKHDMTCMHEAACTRANERRDDREHGDGEQEMTTRAATSVA